MTQTLNQVLAHVDRVKKEIKENKERMEVIKFQALRSNFVAHVGPNPVVVIKFAQALPAVVDISKMNADDRKAMEILTGLSDDSPCMGVNSDQI